MLRDPRDSNYWFRDGERGAINATWTRGTHAIAADIMRRLVPTVTQTTAKVREHDAQERSETDSRLAVVATLLETLAGVRTHRPSHCQSRGRSQIMVCLPGRAPYRNGGTLDISSPGDEVTFDRFRVNAEQAVRMLGVLAGQPAQETDHVGRARPRPRRQASRCRPAPPSTTSSSTWPTSPRTTRQSAP